MRSTIPSKSLFCIALLLCLLSCSTREAKEQSDSLPSIFPDYVGITVPTCIAPLNFMVEGATHMKAVFRHGNGSSLSVEGKDHIDIPLKKWHELAKEKGELQVEVECWSKQNPDGIRYKPFQIFLSEDEIDSWVAYRHIPPGYEAWHDMGIYQRNLTNFEVEPLVENSQNNGGCVNCHAFLHADPNNFMFHARGKGGGTIVCRNGQMEKVDIKKIGGKHGSYNYWHPSGRFIAFSSNNTHQSFYGRSRDKIEVYDLGSDLIIYDTEKHEVLADERFQDSISWETFPTFSPDGKWIYFSSAQAVQMPQQTEKLQYSILRAPFSEEGAIGEVDTVYNALKRGGSVILPRISPDGRYMLYTWAQSGAFHMYHKEADLQMMDLQTGELVDTKPLNSPDVESHHVWSTNGKWVLFASKRVDTRYTRVFLAHWDGQRFGKPFLLPQKDPKQNTLFLFSYNIPEFISAPVRVSRERMAGFFRVKE